MANETAQPFRNLLDQVSGRLWVAAHSLGLRLLFGFPARHPYLWSDGHLRSVQGLRAVRRGQLWIRGCSASECKVAVQLAASWFSLDVYM